MGAGVIHVVIPAAGHGGRFTAAGYGPKPLVDVLGQPMIRRVVDNVRPTAAHRVTVLSQIPLPGVDTVIVAPTRGAVDTLLHADLDGPLLIANCDQLISTPVDALIDAADDGCVATFRSAKAHHSYVRLRDGVVDQIAEKTVISHEAVAGVYFLRDGARFRAAAEAVIAQDRRVLGEFYVSTVLAELVTRGARLTTVDTSVAVLGTPEELDLFVAAAHVASTL